MLTIFSVNSETAKGSKYLLQLLYSLKEISEKLIICVSNNIEIPLLNDIITISDLVFKYHSYIDINRWKDVLINKLQREELVHFNQVLLINDSMYGPLFSVKKIFEMSDSLMVDFWGLTAHGKIRNYFKDVDGETWPRFIQPYFLVIRQPMLSSSVFIEYFRSLPLFESYEDASKGFEFVFTEIFAQKGYRWDVLFDTVEKEDPTGKFFESFILFDIYELVANRGFPFIPKYCFDIDFSEMQIYNAGNDLRKTIEYVNANTEYDVSLIFDNLIQRKNLHDIITHLQLFYTIDESSSINSFEGKAAVFSYLFYEDLFEYSISKIKNVPESIDIYIATDNRKKIRTIRKLVNDIGIGTRCKILLHKGKGRDLSALLVTFHEHLMRYDVIGFIHDKKSSQMAYSTVGQSFNLNSWENMLNSRGFVNGVLQLFDQYPLLGFLSPPMLLHSTYFHTGIDAWTLCKDEVKALAERIGIHANIDFSKNPVALGSVFWCRTKALRPLFEYQFNFYDFPDEPMPVDGTISHAIERIFPYVAQSEGYYSAYIMNDKAASDQLCFYKEALNLIMRELKGIEGLTVDTLLSTIRSLAKLKEGLNEEKWDCIKN